MDSFVAAELQRLADDFTITFRDHRALGGVDYAKTANDLTELLDEVYALGYQDGSRTDS